MITCSTCKWWSGDANRSVNICKRIVELRDKKYMVGEAHLMYGVLYTPPEFSCAYHSDKKEPKKEPEFLKVSTLLKESFRDLHSKKTS